MKTQAISMQTVNSQAYNTRKSSNNRNFNGGSAPLVIVPVTTQEDSFGMWAAKNIITASVFSLVWDAGTNIIAKFSKNVEAIPARQMMKNIPTVAGVFLLIGGIFKAVSNVLDKN